MISEREMSKVLEEYLYENYKKIYREVPIFSKRIDYVCITKNGEIVAIEAKVRNWQRALQQAIYYRICAHRIFVAIWHEFSHRINQNLFNEFGIGLLEVNGEVRELLKPKKSEYMQKTPVSLVKNNLSHVTVGGRVYGK